MKWSKAVFRQYIATFSCLLCSMMTAICFVWYTPLMVRLLHDDIPEIQDLNNDKLSWLIAIIEVGELLGPVPCGFIADRWGRKLSLLLTCPMVLVSWIIHAFTSVHVALFVARVLQGMAIGFFFTAGPSYLAEIAQPNIRGELCGQLQTMWFVGVLYSYCTGPFITYHQYIYASAVPAILFFFSFIFMPESPYFQLMKGDIRGGEQSLMWLRGDEDVADELKTIYEAVERDKRELKGGWKDLIMAPSCRKPLIIITVFGIVKYLGGTATVQNFITHTLSKTPEAEIPGDYVSIGLGIILLIATIIAAFVADKLGRRLLVIWSVILVGVSSTVLALFFYLERETTYDTSDLTWVMYGGFIVYCIGLNIGLGPLQTTLQAEYFPSNLRSASGVYCNLLRNILLFTSLKQYQLFDDNFGVFTNFAFYSLVSYLGLAILYRYMNETANKSLGQIQINRSPSIS